MAKDKYQLSAEASLSGSGTNIRDGRYVLVVDKVIDNSEGFEGDSNIVECIVLKAEANGEMELDDTRRSIRQPPTPVVPNPVGSTVSFVFNFTKQPEMSRKRYKKFVLGVLSGLGATETSFTAEQLTAKLRSAASEKNPLHGIVVSCETTRTVNKGRNTPANAGMIMVSEQWRGISHGDTDEERKDRIQAMRKKIAAIRAGTAAGSPAPSQPAAKSEPAAAVRQDVDIDALDVPAAPAKQPAPAPAKSGGGYLDDLL